MSFAAEKPLSKTSIQAILAASEDISQLEASYPKLFAQLDKLDFLTEGESTKAQHYIESSNANEEFKTILARHNIASFDEMYSTYRRFFAGLSRYQLASTPQYSQANGQMVQFLEAKIAELKQTGGADEMLAAVETQLNTIKSSQAKTKHLAASSNDRDLIFIQENIDWIQQTLEASEQ